MARIRTIKPEFWSDAKIAQLSESCALFFIGLWNFCDDEGKCEDSPAQLALRMPVFRREDISRWIAALTKAGLLQRGSLVAKPSLGSGSAVAWLRVTNWSHQKIDRPRVAKVKMSEITWVLESDSTIDRESSSNVRRKDRKGEETNGSDRIRRPRAKKSARTPKKADQISLTETPPAGAELSASASSFDPIARYFELWSERYGGRAALMPSDFKKLKDFEANFKGEVARDLLEGYFAMPDSWFVTKRHDVQSLMSNLAKVQHFIATGKTVTTRDAKSVEASQSLANQLQRLGGAV